MEFAIKPLPPNLARKWLDSPYSEQYLQCEARFLRDALRHVSGPRVLQIGRVIKQELLSDIDFPELIISELGSTQKLPTSVLSDPAFLPFEPNCFASVLLPHVLERHQLPHQVLREAHRVLMSDGHLVLTGFNPLSLIGLQRIFYHRALYPAHFYTFKRVSDWLKLLGFEIVGSAMFHYASLTKSASVGKYVNFLNSVGDRWLPMGGGGYMIVAKKREEGANLIGRPRFSRSGRIVPRKLVSVAPAKTVD